jgi:hypothetical protein
MVQPTGCNPTNEKRGADTATLRFAKGCAVAVRMTTIGDNVGISNGLLFVERKATSCGNSWQLRQLWQPPHRWKKRVCDAAVATPIQALGRPSNSLGVVADVCGQIFATRRMENDGGERAWKA